VTYPRCCSSLHRSLRRLRRPRRVRAGWGAGNRCGRGPVRQPGSDVWAGSAPSRARALSPLGVLSAAGSSGRPRRCDASRRRWGSSRCCRARSAGCRRRLRPPAAPSVSGCGCGRTVPVWRYAASLTAGRPRPFIAQPADGDWLILFERIGSWLASCSIGRCGKSAGSFGRVVRCSAAFEAARLSAAARLGPRFDAPPFAASSRAHRGPMSLSWVTWAGLRRG
jgi:hypothetical protein